MQFLRERGRSAREGLRGGAARAPRRRRLIWRRRWGVDGGMVVIRLSVFYRGLFALAAVKKRRGVKQRGGVLYVGGQRADARAGRQTPAASPHPKKKQRERSSAVAPPLLKPRERRRARPRRGGRGRNGAAAAREGGATRGGGARAPMGEPPPGLGLGLLNKKKGGGMLCFTCRSSYKRRQNRC